MKRNRLTIVRAAGGNGRNSAGHVRANPLVYLLVR